MDHLVSQDLSIAGNRKGLIDGERSNLFLEQIRIVKEMREHDRRSSGRSNEFIRPRWMVWENVAGAFSSSGKGKPKGSDFQAVLSEIIRIVRPDAPEVPLPDNGKWDKSGGIFGIGSDGVPFSICWRLHDAQFWGATQYLDGRMWIPGTPQRRKRIALVADFAGCGATLLFESQSVFGDFKQGEAEGQRAAGNAETGSGKASRTINVENGGATETICIEGNGIRPSHIGIGFAESNVMYTLNRTEVHAVCYKKIPLEHHPHDSRLRMSDEDVCQTLNTRMGTGGNNVPLVFETYEPAPTTEKQSEDVCISEIRGVQGVGTGECHEEPGLQRRYRRSDSGGGVRRLTPSECEILQGFPKNWTNIGAWTDSKGKLHKESSDSARYKALGNSIALPFWKWLARRIAAQYEREITMGGLFSGIGGFEAVFKMCGVEPVFSSEIEEFPIAVMKRHFGDEESGEEGDFYEILQRRNQTKNV